MTVHDQRFSPADLRRPIAPDGTDQKDTGLISLSTTTTPRAGSLAAIAGHLMCPIYCEPLTFKPLPGEVWRIIY
jgi:hypothetical protein